MRGRYTDRPSPDLAIAFSPDGKTLAVSGRMLTLLDAATGQVRWETKPPNGITPESLAFSPDGKTLVGTGAGITFWEAATGRELRSLPDASDGKLAFSPDGARLASGSYREVKLWKLDLAKPAANAPKSSAVPASPDLIKTTY
mgnify:CR=1 FL=1